MTLPVLNLPLINAKRPKPYIKLKQFRLWLKGLPAGDVQKTSHIVLQQLKILNQSRYPYSERGQLLDALRPTVRQLLLTLKTKWLVQLRFFSFSYFCLQFNIAILILIV